MAKSTKPKKTKTQIEKDLLELELFKWEFLRRNESYIADCKRWRGLSDEQGFDKREIILSYPYKERLSRTCKPYSQTELSKYHDAHRKEWRLLSLNKKDGVVYERVPVSKKDKTGIFRVAHYKRDFSWNEQAEKWEISLPLNPEARHLPFFVYVAPQKIISTTPDLDIKRLRNKIIGVRKRRNASVIRVNWGAPSVYILHEFNKLLDLMKSRQGEVRIKRLQFHMLPTYLDIWDNKKSGMTYEQVAEVAYPRDSECNIESAMAKVKRGYRIAKGLINGGYKKLGVNI